MVYTCGGIIFNSLSLAVDYANIVFIEDGIILGVQEII